MMASGPRKSVAIVGCGVSGLAAIKACLEEGLQPRCFEMNPKIGGLWFVPDGPKPGGGLIMYDSLISNTSKCMTNFSDFPFAASFPPFLPRRLFEEYLNSYADHFKLCQCISFNTKVLQVRKAEDYDSSGCWIVTTCKMDSCSESEQVVSERFDGVILCQGFYRKPVTPKIQGLPEKFQGHVHHVGNYRNSQPFKDKTVIVVGCGSSAGDVACDLIPAAKQVYLSVRTGTYCIPRLSNGCIPVDFRLTRAIMQYAPASVKEKVIIRTATNWLNPATSGIQPTFGSKPEWHLLVNDQLPFKIMTGQLKVVSQIHEVEDGGKVFLKDGRELKEVDDIIFATGYGPEFNAVDSSYLSSEPDTGKLELYKMVFPVSLPHDSLAFIGCLRAKGPLPPIMELQARLAARVLAGKHKLPERAAMKKDIDEMNREQLQIHGCYKYEFAAIALGDKIAKEFGANPNWWRLLLSGDLKLARAVLFGPCFPFHYRLSGPHKWQGARQAALNAFKETIWSTQYRSIEKRNEHGLMNSRISFLPVICTCIFAFIVYFFSRRS